jgi:hypothetical protein
MTAAFPCGMVAGGHRRRIRARRSEFGPRHPLGVRNLLAALVVGLWVSVFLIAPVRGANADPGNYAKALQYAITSYLQEPGYTFGQVVVRPYHVMEIAKGVRIQQFQVWVAYAYRGQSHVLYLVTTPTGEVIDQTIVKHIGDVGGVLG